MNLGSGGKKLPGYVNVDSQPMEEPDVLCDLGHDPWPWPDDSVGGAVCSHVLEHLTTAELFHFMRELYRVCKHGAEIKLMLPHPRHDIYLNDPTHQRPVTPGTIIMFSKEHHETLLVRDIRLTPFWKYLGVDFYLDPKIRYVPDPKFKDDSPEELGWKMQHLNNVIMEWHGTMRAVKA